MIAELDRNLKEDAGAYYGIALAKYHFHYLHEMCRYNKIRYSKNKPMGMLFL